MDNYFPLSVHYLCFIGYNQYYTPHKHTTIDLSGDEHLGLYVIIAIAGYLTAIVRNPLTSVVLIFEITRSLSGFLPLAVTCLFAYFTANLLGSKPVYEYLLGFRSY